MKLLLATRNRHKTGEISEMLKGLPVEVLTLDSFPGIPEVDEDQPTLEGNALKKAEVCARGSGLWALADDTGLEVASLNGEPGVYSARYAGPQCRYEDNNRKLLKALKGQTAGNRQAVFRTVMALAGPRGPVTIEEGRLEGTITEGPRGSNGFGYDPIFELPTSHKTLAELTNAEKNAVSHRANALKKIVPHIKKLALIVASILLFLRPALAERTEPGQETIWDQIMAGQANRSLRIGSKFIDDKRYDLALKEFKAAVAANPKDPNAHMMLGVAYYWTGSVDLSITEYQASLALDPNSAQDWMLIGISLAWKGDVKGAYEAFQKSAAIDPSRPDIQMNLGSIEDSLNKVQDALEHFRKAVALAPREALYHYQLGSFYRKLGRDSDAGEELRQALKYNPDFEDALLELGAVDERLGNRKDAISDFRKAVALKARDSVARFRLGRLYMADSDPAKARAVFADAFHLTPEEGGPGLQLSLSYAGGKKQGPPSDTPDGQPALPNKSNEPAHADPNDPMSVFKSNLERIPLEQGAVMQVDVAFVPKPKLVKVDPESPSSLQKALRKQMGKDSSSGPKVVRREYQLRAASQDERAAQIAQIINDLSNTMHGAPENTDVRLGMNLTFTRLAAVPAGRADADSAPKVSYQPREVGNDMGLWVIGTGWMALVEEMLPEPGDKPNHPDKSDWWVATGLGYATVGDGQRALGAFERACQLDAANEAALLGRGVAYVMTGNEAAAIDSLRQVLKLNPKNRPAGEGLKWLLRPSTKANATGQGG
jgi:XTP/dITP diphosphohydrolase